MSARWLLTAALALASACVYVDEDTPDLGAYRPDAEAPRWPRGFDPPTDCATVLGVPLDALYDDDVARIATLLPESGAAGEAGRSMRRAVALALDELVAIGGLPDGRRVAALACDTRTEPERAFDLTGWLVTDFEPLAIIGPGLSAATFLLDSGALLGRGPLFVSPSATHPDLASLDDGERFWRVAPGDDRPARALGRWMGERAQRVVIVARRDRFGEALSAAAIEGFCGGRCPLDRAPRVGFEPGDDPQVAADAIRAAEADGWMFLGHPDETRGLLAALGTHAPPGVIGFGETLYDPGVAAELDPALRPLVVGVRHGSSDSVTAGGFIDRYRARWGGAPGPFAAHAYDATWLTLHALGALPPGAVADGAALAARFERMSVGESVPAGPAGWPQGQAAFRDPRAGTFDFDGASGPVDFDGRRGVTADVRGWTLAADGTIEDAGVRWAAGAP